MRIGGFQKLSLIDYPRHTASVIFTKGCNFRCHYCHNPELVIASPQAKLANSELGQQKILIYLKQHLKMLDGVCITGGEPTLQTDLVTFLQQVKKLNLDVKLDTNGTAPSVMKKLLKEKLVDYVAMDIKHTWQKYGQVVQVTNPLIVNLCQRTLKLIQSSGVDHEFRTTVFPGQHSVNDFLEMASYLKDGDKYFVQNIRYDKTLDANIDKKNFDTNKIIEVLKKEYSKLQIRAR